jgi:DNA-binding transcriptional MerR regulator
VELKKINLYLYVEKEDGDYILDLKKNLIFHLSIKNIFIFTIRYYISILKFLELNMDIKNIKEMFKKSEESKSSIVKSDVIINTKNIINTKDYALENELNKILRNYPLLNYINQNLENIDIKNTFKEIRSKNEDVVSSSQNIKNVQILKTFLFKK